MRGRNSFHAEKFSEKRKNVWKKAWTKNGALVNNLNNIMSLSLCIQKRLLLPAMLMALPVFLMGESVIAPQGSEYLIPGPLPGDQVGSSISINQSGGYVVWEENGNLKTGTEISAARLDSNFNKIAVIKINKIPKGDQRNPQVQLLSNGDALFVWQGYGLGNADIYARLLKSNGTFGTSDIRVNSFIKDQQSRPVISASGDGGAIVAWQSLNQDGSLFGIYARKLSASGTPVGNEFLVNQSTAYNQRNPAVATLTNGNVIFVWVSEQERFADSVDIYGRVFDGAGAAVTDEILLNSGNNLCANPSVAALASGGFTVVWSEKDALSRSNSWEILGRSFSTEGLAAGGDFKINSTTYGDQYRPKISAVGNDCAVVWTSLAQDGDREGVYGRLLQGGAQPSGNEFRVNNTTVSRQILPTIASDGSGRFLVSWSSFVAVYGFDLFGRKFNLNQQP